MKPKKSKRKEKSPRNVCWDAFSLMIRLKYADEMGKCKCYTCNLEMEWTGGGAQAGHLVPGRGNSVYVNEKVVRIQCGTCNLWNDGEQYRFGKRMESEIGVGAVEELMKLKGQTVNYGKHDWERLTKGFLWSAELYAKEKGLTLPRWAEIKLKQINE